jgi:hypothetical protein
LHQLHFVRSYTLLVDVEDGGRDGAAGEGGLEIGEEYGESGDDCRDGRGGVEMWL